MVPTLLNEDCIRYVKQGLGDILRGEINITILGVQWGNDDFPIDEKKVTESLTQVHNQLFPPPPQRLTLWEKLAYLLKK